VREWRQGDNKEEEPVRIEVPRADVGTGMRAEYLQGVREDKSLDSCKVWAREKKNGFKWDNDILKREVEDK